MADDPSQGRQKTVQELAVAKLASARTWKSYIELDVKECYFFIGDGYRNFRSAPEQILETFYSINFAKNNWITLDWQFLQNPAYNAERGPVNVFGVRYHGEF